MTTINWKAITPQLINETIDVIKETTMITYEKISKIPDTERTFKNTVQPIIDLENEMEILSSICTIPRELYEDDEINKTSTVADKTLSDFDVECGMRIDIFNAIRSYNDQTKEELTDEQQKYIDETLLTFRRNGLELDEKSQKILQEMKKEVNEYVIKFEDNMKKIETKFEFTKEQLKGLPEDLFTFPTVVKDGVEYYIVTLDYPDYYPFMDYVDDETLRKKMYDAFTSVHYEENMMLLGKIVDLRKRIANLLKYDCYADYALEIRMAKNTKTVKEFTDKMQQMLKPKMLEERKLFMQMKGGEIQPWDVNYYTRMLKEKAGEINMNDLREYFPADQVMKGIFEIYQTLLSVSFKEVTTDNVWDPKVKFYEVYDKKSEELVGRFYTDLYPRKNKYNHACCSDILNSCILSNGERQFPLAILICNFSKDGLLQFDEVETIFHEFGHVMHVICNKNNYSHFKSFDVELDFVECPSQMLEHWLYEKEPLRLMSKHVKTGEAINDDLINKIKKTKVIGNGHAYTRQIMMGKLDMALYTLHEGLDMNKLYHDLMYDLLGYAPSPKTNFLSRFGHVVSGYSAGYYSYLWSEVYAYDMFYEKFKHNPLDPVSGYEYRKFILEKGSRMEAMEMIKKFLGREPDIKNFIENII